MLTIIINHETKEMWYQREDRKTTLRHIENPKEISRVLEDLTKEWDTGQEGEGLELIEYINGINHHTYLG